MKQSLAERWLRQLVALRPGEGRALGWSFAYFFFLLAGYYVLRPLRDEMGIAGGVRNLHWLFTATFAVMLAAVPAYGALVARLPRRRFIPLVYHFFVANIAVFWLLLSFDLGKIQVARVFFVWISVFNLFAVSVFWSYMADLFASEQGKRLFGFIAAGGSAGALLAHAAERRPQLREFKKRRYRTASLALEIAANEDIEHRLLELEAKALALRWEEEEALADISDGELTPLARLDRLVRRIRPGS